MVLSFFIKPPLLTSSLSSCLSPQIIHPYIHTYKNVFKLNYDSVHIGSSINYGELSSLKYWNRAISTFEINSIISKGPNLTTIDSKNYADEYPRYLSMNWYNN